MADISGINIGSRFSVFSPLGATGHDTMKGEAWVTEIRKSGVIVAEVRVFGTTAKGRAFHGTTMRRGIRFKRNPRTGKWEEFRPSLRPGWREGAG